MFVTQAFKILMYLLCFIIKYNYNYFLEKVAVTHIDIELAADFKNEKLKGFVDLSITKIDESCDHIVW